MDVEEPPATPTRYLNRHSSLNKLGLLMFGVPAFLGLLGLMYAAVVDKVFLPFAWTVTAAKQHLLMIDAGSHGTRLHVFEFDARVQDPNSKMKDLVTIPTEVYQLRTSPGISAMADTPDMAGSHCIGPLVDAATRELRKRGVKSQQLGDIPVFLKATAGMRDLNVDARQAVMTDIRQFLQDSVFRTRLDSVRVISGEEEGFFGWMTVNAAFGTLLKPAEDTIGALDMGGASAQITFFPQHTSIIEDFYEVYLGGSPIRVYSHSFLGYGWGDALARVSTRLGVEAVMAHLDEKGFRGKEHMFAPAALKADMGDPVPKLATKTKTEPPDASGFDALPVVAISAVHPCFPKGYSQVFDMPDHLFPDGRNYVDVDTRIMFDYLVSTGVAPAVVDFLRGPQLPAAPAAVKGLPHAVNHHAHFSRYGGESQDFYPFDTPAGKQSIRYQIHFEGSSDSDACRARAKALMYDPPCFTHSCSYNGVYQPRLVTSRFMAFGQFAKVQEALGLPANPSMATFERAVVDLCSRDATGFGATSKKMCWKAIWCLTTLRDGYHLTEDSMAVTFATTVGEGPTAQQPGWALGAAIYEVNQMPWISALGRFRAPFFVSFATNLALLGVAVSMALQVENLLKIIRFHDPQSYQPLHI